MSTSRPGSSVLERFAAIDELRGNVDVAILTIKEEEFRAVLDQFFPAPPHIVHGARDYALFSMGDDKGAPIVVAVTRCITQGNGIAQDVTHDILKELDPGWLLLVGIAGAIPTSDVGLGDVVVASSILDFTVEAVKAGLVPTNAVEGRRVHHSVQNIVTMLPAHESRLGEWWNLQVPAPSRKDQTQLLRPPINLREEDIYGTEDWRREVRKALEFHLQRSPSRPNVVAAPIASSDKLIKDDLLLSRWLSVARHVRAVEMESAGVYLAADGRGEHRKDYPVITVRGISDIVGFKRDEAWTRYACVSAAAFSIGLVRLELARRKRKQSPGMRAVAVLGLLLVVVVSLSKMSLPARDGAEPVDMKQMEPVVKSKSLESTDAGQATQKAVPPPQVKKGESEQWLRRVAQEIGTKIGRSCPGLAGSKLTIDYDVTVNGKIENVHVSNGSQCVYGALSDFRVVSPPSERVKLSTPVSF